MNTGADPATAVRAQLARFGGALIGPEDPEYDQARALYNAMIDKRPALIARCAGAEDVAAVIGFSRERDLPLAVRAGGTQWCRARERGRRRRDRSLAAQIDLG
jgi:FAD/FMN-containing dehydrogenase